MRILGTCKIAESGVFVNGLARQFEVNEDWKKDLYASLNIEYPKFYKMDALAKMAFLGVELLESSCNFDDYSENEIALIFANRYSSYDTDQRFIESYTEKGSPGPSLFVYTLPNILTGELAIRKKWYGENIFFINEKFDAQFFIDQINFYFRKGSKACLCGWVDSANNQEECFLFLVENSIDEISIEELIKSYKQ